MAEGFLDRDSIEYRRQGLRDEACRRIGRMALWWRGNEDVLDHPYKSQAYQAEVHCADFNQLFEEYRGSLINPGSYVHKDALEALYNSMGPENQAFLRDMSKIRDLCVEGSMYIDPSDEEPLLLPTQSIVHAPGMESWDDYSQKDTHYIRQMVRKGKRLDAVTTQPTAYVQPNGIVFYDLGNNGAHTASAAIERGDAYVPVSGRLTIRQLTKNIFLREQSYDTGDQPSQSLDYSYGSYYEYPKPNDEPDSLAMSETAHFEGGIIEKGSAVEFSRPAYGDDPTIATLYLGSEHPPQGGVVSEPGRALQIISLNDCHTNPDGSRQFMGYNFASDVEMLVIDPVLFIESRDGGLRGYKGLRRGETLRFGRGHTHGDRFATIDNSVSRDHVSLCINELTGDVIVRDLDSTNGTSYLRAESYDRHKDDSLQQEKIPLTDILSDEENEQQRMGELFTVPDQFNSPQDARRWRVTDDGLMFAARAYRFSNDEVKNIISNYKNHRYWRENDMAELIRGNSQLRIELGKYFLNEIRTDEYDRYSADRAPGVGKQPSMPGYADNLRSDEYVALLALSYLDGTFKVDETKSDPIKLRDGRVELGKHRYAAAKLVSGNRVNDILGV